MAETTPETPRPLQIIEGEADGYCDPVTGVCAVPGVAQPEQTRPDSAGGGYDRHGENQGGEAVSAQRH
ncbi:hypothetical protein [Streptomyces acidicola]|uniref:hypothetical protein n=1 Tax=Streptomyces acidicola TaxID=2596892 RepID=UPI0038148CA5